MTENQYVWFSGEEPGEKMITSITTLQNLFIDYN